MPTSYELHTSETARRGVTDIFFLAKAVLGSVYRDIDEKAHRPICDFFVQKNLGKKFELQDSVKNRLLLAGRGHYKTSLHLVDLVSWMLAFPNVTILLLSGSKDVASRMVEEVKEIFLSCEDFRELYPDFIPTEDVKGFGAKGEFWLPKAVRTRILREPTLSISTLDSIKASGHWAIRAGDDVINEVNSRTRDLNEKVSNDWNATRPLLNPGGYTQILGTYYDFSCMYGKLLDRLKLSDELRFGYPLEANPPGWKIRIYPSLTSDENGNLFNPEGIMFPAKFCVNANADPEKFNLEEAWEEDPENFNAQYMQHPKGTSQDYFPMEIMKRQTIPMKQVPMQATLFGVWDLAYSETRRSDFTVGAIGAYDANNNIYLIDLFRGRWSPTMIIEKFIEAWRKWPLQRQGIEKAAGHPLLLPGLNARMRDLGIQIPIDWIEIKRSKESTVKEILSLSTLLQQGKLWFVSTPEATANTQAQPLPHLAELYVEFSRYGKYSHDDICRAVSMLLFYVGKGQAVQAMNNWEPVEMGGAQAYGEDPCCGAGIVA